MVRPIMTPAEVRAGAAPGEPGPRPADFTVFKADHLNDFHNPAIGSCCDCVEYFLRSAVLVPPGDKRMENRNGRDCQSVNKRGSSSGPRVPGNVARPGGNRWGAGVIRLFSRAAWRTAPAARITEGESA